MPPMADDEYKLLAKRSVTNLMPLLEATPAQSLYVDSFRRSRTEADAEDGDTGTAEMDHWERSRLGAKQVAIHRGALRFGHSFAVTELNRRGAVETRGLSALKTAALYEDPANDLAPAAAITIEKWPVEGEDGAPGRARMWDDTYVYVVTFQSLSDKSKVVVSAGKRHGASECPVTRFAACVDLEGRTIGVIEPLIELQDRINQTVFDLLLAQTYSSSQVRWVSGMAPPLKRDTEGEPVLDANGQAQPIPMNHNARRMWFAEDKDVKFGSLEGSPLEGFISSIGMSIQHFSALSQTPPHYLLGQIANLSADALLAAEISLQRKIKEFQQVFGESWERVFRIADELETGIADEGDFDGEVIWRDTDGKSLAQAADALGKLADQLGIPVQGLWRRVPEVTEQEIAEWTDLAREQDGALALAGALNRATPPSAATAGPSTSSSGDSIQTAKDLAA